MDACAISRFHVCGEHEVHARHWGDPARPLVLIAHGFGQSARNFDGLAARLARRYYVVCPDMIGCGLSSWATRPQAQYGLQEYVAVLQGVISRLTYIAPLRWIGTSMGGAIGMLLAGGPLRDSMSHLLLNDIGPEVPPGMVKRIARSSSAPVIRASAFLDSIAAAETRHTISVDRETLADQLPYAVRRDTDGQFLAAHDERMCQQFVNHPHDADLWDCVPGIACQVLLLRGGRSEMVTETCIDRMRDALRDRFEYRDLAPFGHAPPLATEAEFAIVEEFIERAP
jgi:pimeloyl-ACP methyl ester carboxylesterase